MKNFYYVVNTKQNGKNYAYVIKATESDNLLAKFSRDNITTANACETRKRAESLAHFWNECYKQNGTFMFSEPSF